MDKSTTTQDSTAVQQKMKKTEFIAYANVEIERAKKKENPDQVEDKRILEKISNKLPSTPEQAKEKWNWNLQCGPRSSCSKKNCISPVDQETTLFGIHRGKLNADCAYCKLAKERTTQLRRQKNTVLPGKCKWLNVVLVCLRLRDNLKSHREYVNRLIKTNRLYGINDRTPNLPEWLSEEMVRLVRMSKGDIDCTRELRGDLWSPEEGFQEVKCYQAEGPNSFSPLCRWDVLYFLDATRWRVDDYWRVVRIPLTHTDPKWKNIPMSKQQTFGDQKTQGRRPRIEAEKLFKFVEDHAEIIFEGKFDDLITTCLNEAQRQLGIEIILE